MEGAIAARADYRNSAEDCERAGGSLSIGLRDLDSEICNSAQLPGTPGKAAIRPQPHAASNEKVGRERARVVQSLGLLYQSCVPAFTWPNEAPADIPFERSDLFTEDTWYPSWSSDGDLYTPWTDGRVGNIRSSSACAGAACMSTTGFARVSGEDPFNLTIKDVGVFESSPSPYHGRYPSASLHYDGVWYYGTYALDNENHEPGDAPRGSESQEAAGKLQTAGYCGNWCIQGPFVGFRWSRDGGKTWEEPRKTMANFSDNLFGEGSPDVERINDAAAWEFYAGHLEAQRAFIFLGLRRSMPELIVSAKTAKVRYIMCISTPTFSPFTKKQFDTYLLESPSITGPFRYISYLREFGPEAYFVNIPSKFLAKSRGSDGSLRLFL
ncbi:unnamed protein product, partial [Symbiodinium sp. CCMP2456]